MRNLFKSKVIGAIVLILVIGITLLFIVNNRRNTAINSTKPFTVIVLPDTQNYSKTYPEIFCNQTEWIRDNIRDLNIVFVSHMGDIVNNGSTSPKQWENASKCMKNLDGKVPYSIIPGNHDSDKTSSNKSGFAMYNKYFPVSRFSKYSWYKGNFDNNQNNYELINTGGMSLLFINLQIEPSDEAIAWANTIAKSYPNAYTIVTTHKYLHDSISTLNETRSYSVSGNTGVNIWNKLIKTNCSIKMVLSGHYHVTDGENMINTKNACGDSVAQIVQDYQGRDKGGNGLLRIFTFRPKERRIEVSTYSPYTNTFEEDENSKFTIDLI